jgi:tetratricopeptide (TPR) repeat protein
LRRAGQAADAFGRVRRPTRGAWAGAAMVVAGGALIVLAAARPQSGDREARGPRTGVDLVVAVDVSQSMLAQDEDPSRLAAAQQQVSALLDRLQGGGTRVGLVMFAGRPFPRAPLTTDVRAVQSLLAGIGDEREIVLAGSDAGAAVDASAQLLASGRDGAKFVLLVTDGEDEGGELRAAAGRARAAGVRLYAAGAGTEAGAPVVDIDARSGAVRPRSDENGPVITRLDSGALRDAAAAGGGRYVLLADGALPSLAPELLRSGVRLPDAPPGRAPRELHQWFTLAALLLVAAGTALPLLDDRARRAQGAKAVRRLWPLAAAGLFAGAICAGGVASLNREGNRRYAAGDYAGALDRYRAALALDASLAELHHNAANALAGEGEYDRAVEEAQAGLRDAPDAMRARLEYEIGTYQASAGRVQDAVEAYKRSLLADPADADAKHNLEVLAQRARPSPTPSPPPEGTPSQGSGTPSGGERGTPATDGTPGAGATAEATPQPTSREAERTLEEALAGIDQQFSREDALRVLDLLQEADRAALREDAARGIGQPAP